VLDWYFIFIEYFIFEAKLKLFYIIFKAPEVRQILAEKEINLSNAKEEKDKKIKDRELKIQNEKLQKIQKLEKALEIAKNNLNSPSPVPKKVTKKSNIKEVDSSDSSLLNTKSKCFVCRIIFGSSKDQDLWISCESCNSWLCGKCLPENFDPTDDYECSKCEKKKEKQEN
jgi:hypothetical protein